MKQNLKNGIACIKDFIILMRPKHYVKNLLLFVSITFDGNLFHLPTLANVIGGFLAFSLLSSVVYILNDIKDAPADRRHEVKKHRPVAAGRITTPMAVILAILCLMAALAINALVCGWNSKGTVIMLLYFAANLGYSFGLKHIPFVDVVLLVSGFVLRVLYGSAIVGTTVSSWVYLTVITLSFYLCLGKRRNELRKNRDETRKVLRFYSYDFLDKFMYLCLTCAVVFYALWSSDREIILKYGTDKLVWTIPLVLVLLMKYSADIEKDSYGDPVDVILHDKIFMILGAVFATIMLFMLYYK